MAYGQIDQEYSCDPCGHTKIFWNHSELSPRPLLAKRSFFMISKYCYRIQDNRVAWLLYKHCAWDTHAPRSTDSIEKMRQEVIWKQARNNINMFCTRCPKDHHNGIHKSCPEAHKFDSGPACVLVAAAVGGTRTWTGTRPHAPSLPMSHEPWILSHEPWVASHEPLTIRSRLIHKVWLLLLQ